MSTSNNLFLSILFSINVLVSNSAFAQTYSGGDGSSGNPFQIANKADLKYLSEHSSDWNAGYYFSQTADITFVSADFESGGDFYNSGAFFIPIGNTSSTYFNGKYDGNFHIISGLKVYRTSGYAALFGAVTDGTELKEIILTNVEITGNGLGSAALSGYTGVTGTITVSKCYAQGTVSGNSSVGGLVAVSRNLTMTESFADVNLIDTDYSGTRSGGLIGELYGFSTITNCGASGSVTAPFGDFGGGLVGSTVLSNSTVTNSVGFGAVTGDGTKGGLVGSNSGAATFTNCFFNSTVSPDNGVGTAKTSSELQTASTYTDAGWNFTTIWQISANSFPTLRSTDVFKPTIISLSPANSSVYDGLSPQWVITYNENIVAGTNIPIYIKNTSISHPIAYQTDSDNADVVISGKTVTITPTTPIGVGIHKVEFDANAFLDQVGNGVDGIGTDPVWSVSISPSNYTSNTGSAIRVNGSGNFVDVPYASFYNPSNNFTVDFWAKPTGGSDYRCALGTEDGGLQTGYYFYVAPSGIWEAWVGKGSPNGWTVLSGPTATLNNWAQLTLTFADGTAKFYVNGLLVDQESTNFAVNTTLPLRLGGLAESSAVYGWVGDLDNVRIFRVALTQDEIFRSLYSNNSNHMPTALAFFNLNEGTGSTTNDYYGGNTGTANGTVTWITSTIPVGLDDFESNASFTSGTFSTYLSSFTPLSSFDSPIDFKQAAFDISPHNPVQTATEAYSSRYWIYRSIALETGSDPTLGTFTFEVTSEFTNDGERPANRFRLFRRSAESDAADAWTLYKSNASSVGSESVSFQAIATTGQFMIGYVNVDLTLTGTEGWRLIAAPTTELSYVDVFDQFWTQGFAEADITGGTSNVYRWQTNTGNDSATNWTSISNQSDNFNIGTAVMMYVFGDDNGPGNPENTGFPKSLVIHYGLENGFDKSLTSSLNSNTGGWTLLGNPFGAAFDWDLVSKSGLSNSVYVYDNNASTWKTWNNVTGSLTDGKVGKMNGFFVQTTAGSPTLTVPVSSKLSGENVFLGKQTANEAFQNISLEITGPTGLKNEAFMLFSTEGQEGIDNYDAVKLVPLSPTYVQLSSLSSEGKVLETNHLPVPSSVREIPLQISTTFAGEFKFRVSGIKMNGAWTLTLVDKQLNKSYALDSEITLNLEAGKFKGNGGLIPKSGPLAETADAAPRFVLVLSPETTTNAEISNLPAKTALLPAFPNPFNPSTTLSYQLAEAGNVELSVYDLNGRRIASLVNGRQAAGSYKTQWQAAGISSGVYLIRMQTGKSSFVQKITLLK